MAHTDAPDRPRRRLSAAKRRDALVEAAYVLAASGGYDALTLDAVADRAGVTRNLLYHYFPEGRRDLYLAVLEHGIGLVASEWSTDREIPLADRFEANVARFVDFAEQDTGAWTLLREAGVSRDPEVLALAEGFRSAVIANISVNRLGTPDPPPLVRAALRGFIAYGEAALDEWRDTGLPREAIVALLSLTLVATIDAAREAVAPRP